MRRKKAKVTHISCICCSAAAVFKVAGDTLTRPLPHVYQADAQGTAQPVVPQEELRQEAAATMGTAGVRSAVRVQDLASISQKHVRDILDFLDCHAGCRLTSLRMLPSVDRLMKLYTVCVIRCFSAVVKTSSPIAVLPAGSSLHASAQTHGFPYNVTY